MSSRVLRLPPHGTLLVATDIHGNLRDYLRVKQQFLTQLTTLDSTYLLFLGDLVHGPAFDVEQWPRQLGTYYRDRSAEIVRDFWRLQEQSPGHVFTLLGNHEHSHVGGPKTAKFHADEAEHLEHQLAPEEVERWQRFCSDLPLLGISLNGLVFTHGAPCDQFESLGEIADLAIEAYEHHCDTSMVQAGFVGAILWGRSASAAVTTEFLKKTALPGGFPNRVAIYGHEVVWEGYGRIGSQQLVFTTSLGLEDHNKVYLQLELSQNYASVDDFAEGREIRRLWEE